MLYLYLAYGFLAGNSLLYLTHGVHLGHYLPHILDALVRALIGFNPPGPEHTHAGRAEDFVAVICKDLIVRPPSSLLVLPSFNVASMFHPIFAIPSPVPPVPELISTSPLFVIAIVAVMLLLACLDIATWPKALGCAESIRIPGAQVYDHIAHPVSDPGYSYLPFRRAGVFGDAVFFSSVFGCHPSSMDFGNEQIPSALVDDGSHIPAVDETLSRFSVVRSASTPGSDGKQSIRPRTATVNKQSVIVSRLRTKSAQNPSAMAGNSESSQSIVSGKTTQMAASRFCDAAYYFFIVCVIFRVMQHIPDDIILHIRSAFSLPPFSRIRTTHPIYAIIVILAVVDVALLVRNRHRVDSNGNPGAPVHDHAACLPARSRGSNNGPRRRAGIFRDAVLFYVVLGCNPALLNIEEDIPRAFVDHRHQTRTADEGTHAMGSVSSRRQRVIGGKQPSREQTRNTSRTKMTRYMREDSLC